MTALTGKNNTMSLTLMLQILDMTHGLGTQVYKAEGNYCKNTWNFCMDYCDKGA